MMKRCLPILCAAFLPLASTAAAAELDATTLVGLWSGPNLSDRPYHWRKDGACGGLAWEFRADHTVVVDDEHSFGYSWSVGGWRFHPAYQDQPAFISLRLAHLHTFIPAVASDLKLTVTGFADGRLTFAVDGDTFAKGQRRPPLRSLLESNWLCRGK